MTVRTTMVNIHTDIRYAGMQMHASLIWSRKLEECSYCLWHECSVSVSITFCLMARLQNPSVSGPDWLTEGNQWSKIWFGVKRSTWTRHMYFMWVCVFVYCWILYYSLWCLCASRRELVQRAKFESPLLDGVERLESEQVFAWRKKKIAKRVTIKRTAAKWSHIHMPYQHLTLREKKLGHQQVTNLTCLSMKESLKPVRLLFISSQHGALS